MAEIKNFHEALEADLKRLAVEIGDQRHAPHGMELSEREIIRKSLENFGPEAMPANGASSTAVQVGGLQPSVLPKYLTGKNVDPNVKMEVERLVDLVFHESLEKAVKEVKRHPAFIQDAFHDALIDKLLPELKARGIIK
jgi:hypothetical protein